MKKIKLFIRSWRFFLELIVVFFLFHSTSFATNIDLSEGRNLFYLSVEKKEYIDSAIVIFNKLNCYSQVEEGLVNTYIGALYSLKGKYALWPREKLRWVDRGLKMMDEGILQSPNNIEARFIRGTTCFYLPFFFKRQETAHADFKQITLLLPTLYHQYDSQLILNVIDFLEKNAQLNLMERNQILNIKNHLKPNAF